MVKRARWACVLLAWGLVGLSATAAAAGDPPAAELFSGRFVDFERSSTKVVGVYVPNWEPTALVDGLAGNNVTHLLYAFLHVCGPGQLPVDAPKCEGKGEHELAEGPVDRRFDEAFQRLKARAPHVKVLASVGG